MDRFLIADVVMKADFPAERWFWFDPPFHPARACCCTASPTTSGASTSSSAGTPTDEEEKKPERVIPRIQAMLGDDRGPSSSNGSASTPSSAGA